MAAMTPTPMAPETKAMIIQTAAMTTEKSSEILMSVVGQHIMSARPPPAPMKETTTITMTA